MRRREALLDLAALMASPVLRMQPASSEPPQADPGITLFLCGDVMTGRGIDQILPRSNDPVLYEPWVNSAARYVEIAEAASGPIPRPVGFAYVWGDALRELERIGPDARIINLETAVTSSPDAWQGKGIHYRMHPDNAGCLAAARIDCCALANNHVLDWGYRGLAETLETIAGAGIRAAGAGRDRDGAEAPAVIELAGGRRVLVLAFGTVTSGIPREWAAAEDRAGVALLPELGDDALRRLAARVQRVRAPGDVVVASVHWGGNWGYGVPPEHRRFAHGLIDEAGVDVVHGHSSHHPLGIEVYRDKLILYGCGDFINDYEGIEGHEAYRPELGLMYFATVDPADGRLLRLAMTPTRMRRFQPVRASAADAAWLAETLSREGKPLGTRVEAAADGTLRLRPRGSGP